MAERGFTRRRKKTENGWVRLSFFSLSLPAPALTTTVTCKKNKTQQQVVPFSSRFFCISSSHISVFWASLSSLFEVAGMEEERTRGVSLLEVWGATVGAVRGWSVGTVESRLKKEDLSAVRSSARTALLCSA